MRPRPLLEAHICVAPRRVNRLFATLLQFAAGAARIAVQGVRASNLNKKMRLPFKG
jgi:hypothetical protein